MATTAPAAASVDHAEGVRERAKRDPAFRRELLREAIDALLTGELGVAKSLIRDIVTASIGWTPLADVTGVHEKSLIRMFGPGGHPRGDTFARVIVHLCQVEHVKPTVTLRRARVA